MNMHTLLLYNYDQSIDNMNDFKLGNAAASWIWSSPDHSEDSRLATCFLSITVEFVSLVVTVRVAQEGDEKYLSSGYSLLMILV